MTQWTSGLYRLTQNPKFYAGFQDILGADRSRRRLAAEYIRANADDAVLDVGCGPGSILPYLGQVRYVGIDANPAHILEARAKFQDGTFIAADFTAAAPLDAASFDIVLSLGVLHHLEDAQARELASLAWQKLRPGGRMVTIDPVFAPGQHFVARMLAQADSGRCVRHADEYRKLLEGPFGDVNAHVHHDFLRVPYSHLVMSARKA